MTKKIIVELPATLHRALKDYCLTSDVEPDVVISYAIDNFLKHQEPTVESLKKGYEKMAEINLELSSDFCHCDSETNHLF